MKTKNKVILGITLATISVLAIAWWNFSHSMEDLFETIFDDPENWGT